MDGRYYYRCYKVVGYAATYCLHIELWCTTIAMIISGYGE